MQWARASESEQAGCWTWWMKVKQVEGTVVGTQADGAQVHRREGLHQEGRHKLFDSLGCQSLVVLNA
jgi:hypothetical protein